MDESSNILHFYKSNLTWFDKSKFNKGCITSDTLNGYNHINGDRQSGSTTSILLTVLFDLLVTKHQTHVYLKSALGNNTTEMFKNLMSVYAEVKGNCPNFHLLNNVSDVRYDRIEFRDGSVINRLNPKTLNQSVRGTNHNVWLVIDEEGFLDIEFVNSISRSVAELSPRNNIRRLYSN